MPKKSVSIYDLARIAGVSTATVSKVLNNKGSISQATRDRVLAIAREQGYVANLAAKSLREARSRSIGIVVPDVSNEFFSSIVLRVETLLYDAGYTCYICDSHNDTEREAAYLGSLTQRQVDAIVFVNGHDHPSLGDLPQDLPLLFIDNNLPQDAAGALRVANEYEAMLRDATCALVARGCRHIALLSMYTAPPSQDDPSLDDIFKDALARHGLRLDRNLLLYGKHRKESRVEASELVSACLDEGNALDGIVCIGDRPALGACEALRERGIAVGVDVKVIGMDDSLSSRIASPTISSINRHTDELASRGVEALLALLEGNEPLQRSIVVPHQIVERQSTLGR